METAKAETPDAPAAARVCAKPDCETPLGPKNRIGLCPRHVRWRGTRDERSSAGNGHAVAGLNGANGQAHETDDAAPTPANGSNGSSGRQENVEEIADLAGAFREDRLNRLILSFPATTKAQIAKLWLRGAL